jgi:hypothetical protein
MNYKDIRTGMKVTWGSGIPRGKVVSVDPHELPGAAIKVELLENILNDCGRSFPVGLTTWFPASELRPLDEGMK